MNFKVNKLIDVRENGNHFEAERVEVVVLNNPSKIEEGIYGIILKGEGWTSDKVYYQTGKKYTKGEVLLANTKQGTWGWTMEEVIHFYETTVIDEYDFDNQVRTQKFRFSLRAQLETLLVESQNTYLQGKLGKTKYNETNYFNLNKRLLRETPTLPWLEVETKSKWSVVEEQPQHLKDKQREMDRIMNSFWITFGNFNQATGYQVSLDRINILWSEEKVKELPKDMMKQGIYIGYSDEDHYSIKGGRIYNEVTISFEWLKNQFTTDEQMKETLIEIYSFLCFFEAFREQAKGMSGEEKNQLSETVDLESFEHEIQAQLHKMNFVFANKEDVVLQRF